MDDHLNDHTPDETDDQSTGQPTEKTDDLAIERMAEKIKSSGRRRRPGGRWSNPASPLQAARFAARMTGKEVVAAIRAICPGHGDEPCKIDVSKVSDYETRNRRPAVDHIEAFCRLYKRSPEALGLIKWRDDPEELAGEAGQAERLGELGRGPVAVVDPDPKTGVCECGRGRDLARERLVLDWLGDALPKVGAAVLVEALQAAAKFPFKSPEPPRSAE